MYPRIIKPFLDFTIALIAVFALAPLILIVTVILYISNSGDPFFTQLRPGKHGSIFKIIKFRTMNNKKDSNGLLLADEKRLTGIGKFVRKTSLDELPQLFNVLKGDMSIVGPRPLLPEYLETYTPEQARRHEVKPGITGLAQVRGRNLMKFSDRLINDVFYVNNISASLDLKILYLTVKTVLFKSASVVAGQTVDEIDDIGLSRNLSANHFKNKQDEH